MPHTALSPPPVTTLAGNADVAPSSPKSTRAAYVHVPFCRRRCGYCNFTVLAGRDELTQAYLTALDRELSGLGHPREVDTLFVGGGTPTHLPRETLSRLLELVTRWFPPAAGCEFSVEANPADVTQHRVEALASAGVNRLSLGAQSFDDETLRRLERDHTGEDVERAFALARETFATVSLDLMFACPGQTLEAWRRDLRRAVQLRPDGLSTYGLTYERGTTFFNRLLRGDLRQAPEETWRRMYALAIDALGDAGYEHYEVSNFARPGRRCRHNENYWLGGNYFAAGPGAARHFDGRRETNHRSPFTWLKRMEAGRSPVAERETLSPDERARETLVLGLRRLEGVDRGEFEARTGCDLDRLAGAALGKFVSLGLLADDGSSVRLTRRGLFVSDGLWPELL